MRQFSRNLTVALALLTSAALAAEKSPDVSRTSEQPPATNRTDITRTDPDLTREIWDDLPLLNPEAELEATDVYFTFEYHTGADVAHSHRVEAVITNIDSTWSGWGRTWEIYSIVPGLGMSGITLVDAGQVPPLAPGKTHKFWRSLPSSVNLNATYVLMLSAGDANRDNDFAVDEP